MKILVVCQHYWPEPYYLSDVCEELVKRGHEVHVITDIPNYPMGYIYDDYKHHQNREQTHEGVKITRTFTIGRRNNAIFRLLNYYSYSISSTLLARKLSNDYDVVFANQTSPIMMTRAATYYSRKWGKKCVMYCLDVWPACLAAGGLKPQSIIYRIFGQISKKLYNRADIILISSKMFRNYLENEHKIADEKIKYCPQYAMSFFDKMPECQMKKTIDFVFAGNVGAAQRIDVILYTAKALKNEQHDGRQIRWHIVGDGSELDNLKDLAHSLELDNVIFYGRKPIEEMPNYYALADAMLVSLTADPFISLTLPGKIQTYMAAGKPILASANGEISAVLEEAKCGFCAPAEDAEAFTEIVKKFLASSDWQQLGKNARQYYENNFTKDRFMNKIESELKNF